MNNSSVCGLAFLVMASAQAAEIYVDNVKGSDRVGDGSPGKPLQTIGRALQRAKTSDAVFLTPNPEPYRESVRLLVGGTAEKPFVFDGRGAVIDRLTHYGAENWKAEGGGVFSMPLPNNAHVMDKSWQGFDLVFFDGTAGTNCASREALKPNGYFLYKNRTKTGGQWDPLHNVLFVCLPSDQTPVTIKVEAPGAGTTFHVGTSHVTVKNLTARYSTQDGFASTGATGLLFERVRGCYNMDQGISHHGSEVTVRDSRFDHNAGCGIVDVYTNVIVRYERCLIENDTYRGGVEFHSGEFTMQDCVIRGNPGKAFLVTRGARATFTNCLFSGPEAGDQAGGVLSEGLVTLDRCTFYRFGTGLTVERAGRRLTMTNCAFIQCQKAYGIQSPAAGNDRVFVLDWNVFDAPAFRLDGAAYAAPQWDEFRRQTGWEAHSTTNAYTGPLPPLRLPLLEGKGKGGADIGANLEGSL